MKAQLAHEILYVGQVVAVDQQVMPFRTLPAFRKLQIADEDVGLIRCIGTILEIVDTAIQEQSLPIGVEKHRRKCVVSVRFVELSWRALKKSLRKRIRAEVGVKADQRDARSLKENDHSKGKTAKVCPPKPGGLLSWLERLPYKQDVGGSSPSLPPFQRLTPISTWS